MIPGCSPQRAPNQPAIPSQVQANITCNEFSFYLDPSLGDGHVCTTIPESSNSDIPMNVFIYPTHTELTIKNYPLEHTQFSAQILIYPVSRFSELLPNVLPGRVSDLKRLISGETLNNRALPFLPPLPLLQTFSAHETILAFSGGQGVRFITEYDEGSLPISNRNIIYTFQGLTSDGKYWVAVTLPISHPSLPASADLRTLPEGYSEETWFKNYTSYVADVETSLEAQTPGSFFPTLTSLDNLITSISIR